MRKALRLARRGEGATSPNPPVGAVVVAGDQEVGGGWHRGPGEPHAEVEALERAGDRARGATMYVTLEPCSHQGRTPPCTKALLAAEVRRVVAAVGDPDPLVSGRGFEELRAKGVEVATGLLAGEAERLYSAYFLHRRLGRPFVTYKAAMSLDGRLAAADGSSRWITGEEARRDVHRIRAKSDAICVGIGTVLADDPSLTVREVKAKRFPLRVVVDSHARTPAIAAVLRGEAPTLVATTNAAPDERIEALRASGAEVVCFPGEGGRVAVTPLLAHLGTRGILSLLLEGGGTLAGSFAAAGALDRLVFYLAPKMIGGAGTAGALEGWSAVTISEALPLEIESMKRFGTDTRIVARPRREGG